MGQANAGCLAAGYSIRSTYPCVDTIYIQSYHVYALRARASLSHHKDPFVVEGEADGEEVVENN